MPEEALIARYRDQLLALQRPGKSRTRREGSEIYKLMEGRAVEMARIHEAVIEVVESFDPRTPGDLLEDWEEMLGLPDGCSPDGATIDERIAVVVARWIDRGETTIAALIAASVTLGYDDAAITRPIYVGFNAVGTCVDPVITEEWKFASLLTATSLGTDADAQLVCTLRRMVQLHGWLIFELAASAVPAAALLDESDDPLLDESDDYILDETG